MSSRLSFQFDDQPMSSKIFTIVLAIAIVGPFAYFVTLDAVSIKQHLHHQAETIQSLKTESVQLDQQLDKTIKTKKQSKVEVEELEKQAIQFASERERLEAELGAN